MAGIDGIEAVGGMGEWKLMPDKLSAIWIQRDNGFLHRSPSIDQMLAKARSYCVMNGNLLPKRFIQERLCVFVIVRNALRAIPQYDAAIAAAGLEIADHFQAKGFRPVVEQGVRRVKQMLVAEFSHIDSSRNRHVANVFGLRLKSSPISYRQPRLSP
jgi:hypothetical protein